MEPLEFSHEWFDASSRAWRMNKKRVGQSWTYICSREGCNKSPIKDMNLCKVHSSVVDIIAPVYTTSKHTMLLRPRKK
jgi:hypothetical protein